MIQKILNLYKDYEDDLILLNEFEAYFLDISKSLMFVTYLNSKELVYIYLLECFVILYNITLLKNRHSYKCEKLVRYCSQYLDEVIEEWYFNCLDGRELSEFLKMNKKEYQDFVMLENLLNLYVDMIKTKRIPIDQYEI